MRHSTHGRSHFLVRLACVKHAASVQSEPESNSPVQICIKSLRQSRRNQNLKVLFPFAIHLSMNQNLPPFQAASGFMPFSSSTVKNFFFVSRFFFRGRISFLPSRRKVRYRLFDFHLSRNFLNFFWKLSKLPSRLAWSLSQMSSSKTFSIGAREASTLVAWVCQQISAFLTNFFHPDLASCRDHCFSKARFCSAQIQDQEKKELPPSMARIVRISSSVRAKSKISMFALSLSLTEALGMTAIPRSTRKRNATWAAVLP